MNLDGQLYRSFVAPQLCVELREAGLYAITPFCWYQPDKEKPDIWHLFSLQFDLDEYYSKAFGNVNYVSPINFVNAFQFKDMESLLPDYLLTRNNTDYELHCSSLFSLDVLNDGRMPDVFAKMVLKGIRERKIDIENARTIFNAKIV